MLGSDSTSKKAALDCADWIQRTRLFIRIVSSIRWRASGVIKVMFLHKRFDLRLLVFLLGACFARSIGFSFVSFLDTASDRTCCFGVSFLIFIENVTRTTPLPCLPDTVPHQLDSFLNLPAKIQEMDSVVSIRPPSDVEHRHSILHQAKLLVSNGTERAAGKS